MACSGDLLLINEGITFEGRLISRALSRGVAATTDGLFLPRQTALEVWNDVGIIVDLSPLQILNDDSIKGCERSQKFVLMVDSGGVVLIPLEDVTELCLLKNSTCAIRKLKIDRSEFRKVVDSRLLSLASSLNTCYQRWTSSGYIKQVSFKVQDPSLTQSIMTTREIVSAVIDRISRVVKQPSPDEINEILRIFFMLDEEKSGSIPVDKMKRTLRQDVVNKDAQVPAENGSVTAENDVQTKPIKSGPVPSLSLLGKILNSADMCKDGVITLVM